MADVPGTIVTFTVDRLAYSPSPPIVFAVVDFDGGGRFPVELTDVRPDDVAIGGRVEMTFRRLFDRRRHPQLLLEGATAWVATGSPTASPSSGWAARKFGEHWDKSADDLMVQRGQRHLRQRGR